jgi:SAM-dependent methyltransferase
MTGSVSAHHLPPPRLEGLSEATSAVDGLFAHLAGVRQPYTNSEGGDLATTGNRRSLVRHTANYVAAASMVEARPRTGPLVDVGGGVGALGAWLADRLDTPWHLVEPDPLVRRTARDGFPEASVHADLDDLATDTGGVVTAMEVIEHIPPRDQADFLRGLHRVTAPGGVIVLSTPDETDYLGGHSGYGPHVGVLAPDTLVKVVRDATGLTPQVWRLEGDPFRLHLADRYLLPFANRVWATLQQIVPGIVQAATRTVGAVGDHLRHAPRSEPVMTTDVRATSVAEGRGSGLIAAVAVPG